MMFVPEADTIFVSSLCMTEPAEMSEYIGMTEDVRSRGRHNLWFLIIHDRGS